MNSVENKGFNDDDRFKLRMDSWFVFVTLVVSLFFLSHAISDVKKDVIELREVLSIDGPTAKAVTK